MQSLQSKAVKMLILKPRNGTKSVKIMYKDNKRSRVRKANNSCNDFKPEFKKNFKKVSKSSTLFEESKNASIYQQTRDLIKHQKQEKLKSLKLQFDLE